MNVLSNYTTNYNHPSPATYRNKAIPNFKEAINPQNLENQLSNGVKKIESKHGLPIIFTLAMAGLASLIGVYNKFTSSDLIKRLHDMIVNSDINIISEETTLPEEVQNSNESTVPEKTPHPNETTTPEHTSNNNVSKSETAQNREEERTITPQEINIRYENLLKEKPVRKEYLIYLENYPNLLKKYKNLLTKKAINECDQTTKDNLRRFERVIGYVLYNLENTENDKKIKKVDIYNFWNSLNTTYLKDFDDICLMLDKEQTLYNNNKGRKVLYAMNYIAKKEVNLDYIKEYMKYPNLSYCEYISIKECGREDLLQYFSDMKEKYDIQECRLVKSLILKNEPDFAIQFNYKTNNVNNRLEVIIEIFEKLHGKVTLHPGVINGNGIFNMANLFDELHSRLRKDSIITPLYNFVKFISPETLKEYNYTENELNQIFRPTEEDLKQLKDGTIDSKDKEKIEKFIELERKIGSAIAFLDDNEKCKEIIEIVNDKKIFQDCIDNLHAILRFICRFIINGKNNPENDFMEECKKQVSVLKSDIYLTTGKSTLIRPYIYNNRRGIAPKFYFDKECKLGNNISATLDINGRLHTIFESLPKES